LLLLSRPAILGIRSMSFSFIEGLPVYNICVIMVSMLEWTVEYYKDAKGSEPVAEFIDSLPIGAQAKIFRLIGLLARYHVLLKEPYTKQIKGKVRELRIVDAIGKIRVLYFGYTDKRFVLLHGFVKKEAKTPKREIEIAEKRIQDYMQRHGGAA
jgi:phage-related protein